MDIATYVQFIIGFIMAFLALDVFLKPLIKANELRLVVSVMLAASMIELAVCLMMPRQ